MELSEKIVDAYVQRMSKDLQEKFLLLSTENQTQIMKSLIRFHHVIEEETFELLQGILNAYTNEE
ncbi:MAG: hypothetical protein ACOWW1_06015 [archaeon]|nr:hypothetical protein [Candidatus Bathyarchaeum sp.]